MDRSATEPQPNLINRKERKEHRGLEVAKRVYEDDDEDEDEIWPLYPTLNGAEILNEEGGNTRARRPCY